jgi:hypothetical protein
MAKKPRADDARVRSESRRSERLLEPTLQNVDALDVEAVVVGLCRDVRPLAGVLGMIDWRLCGRVSRLVAAGAITGVDGERVLMPTHGRIPAPRLFFYGWGDADAVEARRAVHVAAMAEMVARAGVHRVAFAFPEPAGELVLDTADVERCFGARLVAFFGADPLGAEALAAETTARDPRGASPRGSSDELVD